ncbi:MAG: peptide chain release factor N(5)-glutamine methyltransferase [Anaerolineae bacterium]
MNNLTEPTLRRALRQATASLQKAGIDTPGLEAELLLAHVLGCERSWLHAHDEAVLPPEKHLAFEQLLSLRRERVPLAYLTGHKEFFGLDFEVSPAVLIPRPETELLVEKALQAIGRGRPTSVVDVGTGSGCIAVTLAVHAPAARIIATDVSAEALAVAQRNAGRHGLKERVHFLQGDLLLPLSGPLDLILSNPPYIGPDEFPDLMPEVRDYEPRPALAGGGADGLQTISRLLAMIPPRLRPGGAFLLEIGAGQGPAALALARQALPAARLRLEQDLAGRDRLLVGQHPPNP